MDEWWNEGVPGCIQEASASRGSQKLPASGGQVVTLKLLYIYGHLSNGLCGIKQVWDALSLSYGTNSRCMGIHPAWTSQGECRQQ